MIGTPPTSLRRSIIWAAAADGRTRPLQVRDRHPEHSRIRIGRGLQRAYPATLRRDDPANGKETKAPPGESRRRLACSFMNHSMDLGNLVR